MSDSESRRTAAALRVSIGLLLRRLRQVHAEGEPTLPQISALARLERGGPTTPSALARLEQISAQSMGATLGALEVRGLVERSSDPGRRPPRRPLHHRGGPAGAARPPRRKTELLARALASGFTPAEVEQLRAAAPLLERLAQTI